MTLASLKLLGLGPFFQLWLRRPTAGAHQGVSGRRPSEAKRSMNRRLHGGGSRSAAEKYRAAKRRPPLRRGIVRRMDGRRACSRHALPESLNGRGSFCECRLPWSPATETALHPPIRCFESLPSQGSSSPEECSLHRHRYPMHSGRSSLRDKGQGTKGAHRAAIAKGSVSKVFENTAWASPRDLCDRRCLTLLVPQFLCKCVMYASRGDLNRVFGRQTTVCARLFVNAFASHACVLVRSIH